MEFIDKLKHNTNIRMVRIQRIAMNKNGGKRSDLSTNLRSDLGEPQ